MYARNTYHSRTVMDPEVHDRKYKVATEGISTIQNYGSRETVEDRMLTEVI